MKCEQHGTALDRWGVCDECQQMVDAACGLGAPVPECVRLPWKACAKRYRAIAMRERLNFQTAARYEDAAKRDALFWRDKHTVVCREYAALKGVPEPEFVRAWRECGGDRAECYSEVPELCLEWLATTPAPAVVVSGDVAHLQEMSKDCREMAAAYTAGPKRVFKEDVIHYRLPEAPGPQIEAMARATIIDRERLVAIWAGLVEGNSAAWAQEMLRALVNGYEVPEPRQRALLEGGE